MSADAPTSIGARIPRRELKRLLSGHGRYIDDIKLPRMLHACFVRSPHPHARIKSIDTSKAEALPGVKAVVTARDIVDFPVDKSVMLGITIALAFIAPRALVKSPP